MKLFNFLKQVWCDHELIYGHEKSLYVAIYNFMKTKYSMLNYKIIKVDGFELFDLVIDNSNDTERLQMYNFTFENNVKTQCVCKKCGKIFESAEFEDDIAFFDKRIVEHGFYDLKEYERKRTAELVDRTIKQRGNR